MIMKRKPKAIPFEKFKADMLKDPGVLREYNRLKPEFEEISRKIEARIRKKRSLNG